VNTGARQSATNALRFPEGGLWLGRWIRIDERGHWTRLLPHALALVFVSAVFTLGLHLRPSPDLMGTHQQLGFPPCSFRAIFGLPCPGCGGTTAVCYMLRGQPLMALKSSLFGTAVFLALLVTWLLSLAALVLRRPIAVNIDGMDGVRLVGYTVSLMLVSWVVKIAYTLLTMPGIPS